MEFLRSRFDHEEPDFTPDISDMLLELRLKQIREKHGAHLGIFLLYDRFARRDWSDPETGFDLHRGECFLDVNLWLDTSATRDEIEDSLKGLAYYVNEDPDLKYVLGVTYEKLARLSLHYGFTLSEKPFPDFTSLMRKYYPKTPRGIAGKPMGKIMLVFQEREQFLRRFLPDYQPQEEVEFASSR
ncbi:hypothetical protein A2165_03030 [Candidatus Curtissbacteria bacterium RBG_13_40_7]|uniref:Uncharacterized protein n=1 Tax=Candidatus Curtissbacteria bacterium RBG_13_40_7 TaxID=1797706 RepID=A0A1F5FVL5_9BACT|nr:MAG: hypothetical protein A2165_03030 [Candidatus Curtissbacteria bacterium RBG_13_40_7]